MTSCVSSRTRNVAESLENPFCIESTPLSHLLQALAKNRVSKRAIAVCAREKRYVPDWCHCLLPVDAARNGLSRIL